MSTTSYSPSPLGARDSFWDTSSRKLSGTDMSHSPAGTSVSRSPNNYKRLPLPPTKAPPLPQKNPKRLSQLLQRGDSLYSEVSTWNESEAVPEIPDLESYPVPKVNSLYWRHSTGSSSASMSEPQLLLPRTYKPSFGSEDAEMSGSPTTYTPSSQSSSPDAYAAREQRPSALLPSSLPVPQLPRKQLHTVPLSTARAAYENPASEHLLPEEMIARLNLKAKPSQDPKVRPRRVDKPLKSGPTEKTSGTEGARIPSRMMFDAETLAKLSSPQPQSNAKHNSHWSGTTANYSSRERSRARSVDSSSSEAVSPVYEMERGRTLDRIPRGMRKIQVQPARRSMAAQYEELVLEPWADDDSTPITPITSSSPAPATARGDDELCALPSIPRAGIAIEEDHEWTSSSQGLSAYGSEDGSHDDTSGVIPISPPLPTGTPKKSKRMSIAKKYRESAYYPYITSRKRVNVQHASHKPRLAQDSDRKRSSRVHSRLLARAAQKAIKIADKVAAMARPYAEKQPTSPADLSQSVTGVYLGWSEESKDDCDASKPPSAGNHYAPDTLASRPAARQSYIHAQTAARPLDERAYGASDEHKRHSRRSSILGLMDLTRDKGREKRREELKKSIRLITTEPTRPARDGSELM